MRDFISVYRRNYPLLLLAILLKPFKAKCLETDQVHSPPIFRTNANDLGRYSEALGEPAGALEANGFRRVAVDHLAAVGSEPGMTAVLHYRSDIGTIAITCLTHERRQGDPIEVVTGLITRISSGRVVQTSNPVTSMPPPSFMDRVIFRKAEVDQLIEAHLPRIAKKATAWDALSDEEVIREHLAFVEEWNQYFRKCGVYGPLVPN